MTKSPELSTENYRSSKARVRQVLLIKVTRTHYFAAKATFWLSPGNHNHLRITRILRCLSLLGLEAEARAFFECLSEIYENEQSQPRPAFSTETILYWRRAVGDAVW